MALGDAADGEGVFKIDVDGLSDEALDISYTPTAVCGFANVPVPPAPVTSLCKQA